MLVQRLKALIDEIQVGLDCWGECQECGMIEQEDLDLLVEIKETLVSLGV